MSNFTGPDDSSAQPVTVEIDGKSYTFTPLMAHEMIGEIAAKIRSDALNSIYNDLVTRDPSAKREIMSRIALQVIPMSSVMEWCSTYEGRCWLVWKSLKKTHTELKITDVEKMDFSTMWHIAGAISGLESVGEEGGGEAGNFPDEEESTTSTSET